MVFLERVDFGTRLPNDYKDLSTESVELPGIQCYTRASGLYYYHEAAMDGSSAFSTSGHLGPSRYGDAANRPSYEISLSSGMTTGKFIL
jgi:hypothetical protein